MFPLTLFFHFYIAQNATKNTKNARIRAFSATFQFGWLLPGSQAHQAKPGFSGFRLPPALFRKNFVFTPQLASPDLPILATSDFHQNLQLFYFSKERILVARFFESVQNCAVLIHIQRSDQNLHRFSA